MLLDYTGKVSKFSFSGNSAEVLTGNSTWTSITGLTGWTTVGGVTYSTNKIGIGVTSPSNALEVAGTSLFYGDIVSTGHVIATEFIVGDVNSQGKNLRISTDVSFDAYDPISGMRNEIKIFTQPFYINSQHGYNYNTILNSGQNGNVGIGVDNPLYKLDIFGSFHISGESFHAGKSYFSHISGMLGDSALHVGDSSIVLDYTNNRIYAGSSTGGFPSLFTPKGLGLGSMFATATGTESVAIGKYAISSSTNSVAIGTYVSTITLPLAAGGNKIVIGSGVSATQPLVNAQKNSLIVGFNSNLATLYVGASTGINTTGNVGIATTEPEDKLQIGKELGKLTFGDAQTPALNYGTSYIGFNASRLSGGLWKTDGDTYNNGGAVIFGNVAGHLYFSRIPNTNSTDQTGVSDATIYANTSLFIDGVTGDVAIGTTCIPSDSKLTIEGTMRARRAIVETADWCDYVSAADYKLLPIIDLGKYFKTFFHLPNFKSQEYYITNGVDVVETEKATLKTLEEYALYIVELKKEQVEMKKNQEVMEQKIIDLEKRLNDK